VKEARRLKSNFYEYFRAAWPVLYPEVPFTESWHYDYLAECLQYAASGQMKKDHPERRGLIINVPPRTLKSTEVNIFLPGFVWASHPEKKFLCVSYGQELAVNEISTKRRKVVTSDWYTQRYPKVQLVEDLNVKHRYDTTAGGYAIATTPGGFAAGSGANIIIIDDIIKMSDESVYGADRENANKWYETEGYSRLNNQAEDFFIVICQRLHEQDFPGYLNKNEPGLWWNIVIPLECEEDTDYVFPLSGKVYHRKKGEVLLPSRFLPHNVEQLKRHALRWAGQYQQKPMPATGNLCDPSKWLYFDSADELPTFDQVLLSVDASFKKSGDPCCITKQGFSRASQYMLDCINKGMDVVELEAKLIELCTDVSVPENERPTVLLIEEAANGAAVIQRLRKLPNPLPVAIVAITPEGGKMSRAMAAQPEQSAGNCYLPARAPWLQAFKTQLALGPDIAEHDDMIDSWSQGWTYRRSHRWGYYEALEAAKDKQVRRNAPVEKSAATKPTAQQRIDAIQKLSRDTFRQLLRRR
jgi:predicted phage terminase large subunit-like protein